MQKYAQEPVIFVSVFFNLSTNQRFVRYFANENIWLAPKILKDQNQK